jgi:amidase
VPQGRGILPGLTAQENLRLAWTPDSGETEESAIERVVGLLPRLSRLLDRRGGTLSGGEQQILALARALVGSPWLLILDEPVGRHPALRSSKRSARSSPACATAIGSRC